MKQKNTKAAGSACPFRLVGDEANCRVAKQKKDTRLREKEKSEGQKVEDLPDDKRVR